MSNEKDRQYFIKEMERTALRLNEPELRDLKLKLENDFVRKNQACQIKEKEYRALREQIDKKRERQLMLEQEISDLKIHAQEKEKRIIKNNKYGKDLLTQMEDHDKNAATERERNQIQEKLEMDKSVAKLKEENAEKLHQKRDMAESTQQEMKLFLRAKEVDKSMQKLKLTEEDKKIEQRNKELDESLQKIAEEKKKKIEAKEALKNQISENLSAQKIEKEERDNLIEQLEEYEYMLKRDDKYFDQFESEYEKKQAIKHGELLKGQIHANIARTRILQDQGDEYSKQLKLEIQKQKELHDNEQKIIALRKKQYSTDIKQQIKDNIEEEKTKKHIIEMTNKYMKKFNDEIARQLEEQKERLLEEHNYRIMNIFPEFE